MNMQPSPPFPLRPLSRLALATIALACFAAFPGQNLAQTPDQTANAASADAHKVPVMDGGIGTCTADFTVIDNNQAPVYDAKIHVHIAYGFMYMRKLDLDQATNVDGKARFIGIPSRTKRGLSFEATQGDRAGTAFVDPDKTCNAQLTITLQPKAQ